MNENQDQQMLEEAIVRLKLATLPQQTAKKYPWGSYALHTIPHPTGNILKVLKVFAGLFLFQFFFPFVLLIFSGIWFLLVSSAKAGTMWVNEFAIPTTQNLLIAALCFICSLFVTSELAIQIGDRVINWLQE